ncbi:MAG TPA: hypothetical protein VGH65_08170, partial [Verrucomicrobiaceae bacterium]
MAGPSFVKGSRSFQAQMLTQLARSLGHQHRFAEARQILDKAGAVIGDEKDLAKVRLWLERGRMFYFSVEYDRARTWFLAAWHLANELGEEYYAVDAAHMLGL